jgi:soluble lytic murein transglycosylase-like protein
MCSLTIHTTGMHNDDISPLFSHPEKPDEDARPTKPGPIVHRLPVELNNWQVWDVDGASSTLSSSVGQEAAEAETADFCTPHIPDRTDDIVIATLPERRWQVEPGAAVTLPVTVLNNGTHRLAIRAHLEGWLDDRWVAEPYVQVSIAPGEQRTLELTVAPPRNCSVEAGDYHLAIVLRSPDEPARTARLGVILAVLPFDRILVDLADAVDVPATWWRRTLSLPVRVTNEGNCTRSLRLVAATPSRQGRFVFPSGEDAETVALAPGQRMRVPLQLNVRRLPLMALHSRSLPFVLQATADDGRVLQQMNSRVEVHPIVGGWQIFSLVGLAMAGTVAAFLMLVLGMLFLRINAADAPVIAPAPVAYAAPAVIVVTLNQPVNANAVSLERAGGASALAVAPQSQPDPSLPLVLPDQVTAPGSGGPARAAIQPSVVAAQGSPAVGADATLNSSSMSYAQMFQSIGAQYDLDWRMLAAQAYIESGFDTLALSSAGAMGLMQVLPSTWREWAPAANANDPFDSYSNVRVAAVYLDYLRVQLARQGYPETEWMLVAYNWGIDRLNDFLAGGGDWQELPEARRRYAEEILRIAQTLP